ncbi:hypothetical protein DC498_11600 [Terrimonas sp.]|uniref:glycosyltransferase family 2 protein n=1 Tax=Terrimonas sp. TaxID=1914338 RepID=UPI000D516812|nr:glycosyltransferase [Terrimonas sp.]PVD52027.1 hypothetical protein DC498_11600 [Terrimonas sp.]
MNGYIELPTKVSVIIPVYNRLEFLSEALESIYAQLHRPIEIIIVDNGSSTDNATELDYIAQAYKNRDKDIGLKLLRTDKKGAPHARNTGFNASTSEIIQFLDSDDVLLPEKISEQLDVLNKYPNLDMVYSKAQHTDEHLNRMDKFWGRKLDGTSMDYFLFSWQTMCPLYKKSTILKYGLWDESLQINQDWEFSLRYIIKGANAFFLDKVHCLFRIHTKGNIGSIENDLAKVESKWQSTQKIYRLLQEKRKIDGIVKKAFLKRWIYILLITSKLGAKKEFNQQLTEIRTEIPSALYLLMATFNSARISKILLKSLGYNKTA